MAANQLRGTPGMLLMAFAVAMLILAVWQWTQKRDEGAAAYDEMGQSSDRAMTK